MGRLAVLGVSLVSVILLIAYIRTGHRKSKVQEPAAVPVQPAPDATPSPFVSATSNPAWDSLLKDYEEYIITSVNRNLGAGVAVAILKDTSILFLRAYGMSNHQAGDSTTVHSIFRLGSVSKCFASVLTGRMVDQGVLSWDDKVIKFLPGFALSTKESTEQVTLRHLLSHTSGLPYHAYTDRIDDGANMDTLIYHLRDLKLTGPPGELYSYQNVAYSIMGKVLESATGKPYRVLMSDEIFKPLKMDASMTFDELVNNRHKASPHIYTARGWRALPISETYYNAGPAGGVNASISDMARFLQALDGDGTLLHDSTRSEIFKPYIRATARNRNFRRWKRSKGSYYGLGWRVLTFKDDTLNYHGGYVNGYRSEVAIEQNGRIAICVLVNSSGPLADNAVPEFFIRYEKKKKEIEEWETGTKPLSP